MLGILAATCQKTSNGDDETLREQNTASSPSIGSP